MFEMMMLRLESVKGLMTMRETQCLYPIEKQVSDGDSMAPNWRYRV